MSRTAFLFTLLLVLSLSGNSQLVIAKFYLHIILLHAREVETDEILAIGFFHIASGNDRFHVKREWAEDGLQYTLERIAEEVIERALKMPLQPVHFPNGIPYFAPTASDIRQCHS